MVNYFQRIILTIDRSRQYANIGLLPIINIQSVNMPCVYPRIRKGMGARWHAMGKGVANSPERNQSTSNR